jgi:FlaA1/EpsC-like NDP-sugar epimerase
VIFIDWLLTLACTVGLRLSVRVVAESRRPGRPRGTARRVLVAGAGDAGMLVARELMRNPALGMVAVGFLDDDPAKRGKQVLGLRVLGPLESLTEQAARLDVSDVIIAMPRAGGKVLRRVLDQCRDAGLPALAVPGVYELLGGSVSVNRLRTVEIGDLLRREQVNVQQRARDYLAGRVVLVTGGGCSIGFELCRQAAEAGAREVVMLGHGENSLHDALIRLRDLGFGDRLKPVVADMRRLARLEQVFTEYRPQVVLHAAAHKHVPLMEVFPGEAVSNNVGGTQNLVAVALAHEVERFVLISTDKAVAPSSVMGATKRLAEAMVRDAARRSGRPFLAVRFGNVLGSRGSVVPVFQRQIQRGGPVTITHPDMRRFFMTIPEAVHLVLEAGALGRGGELFILNMGEQVRIVDLARDLIRLSGLGPDEIEIRFSGLRPGEKLEEQLYEDGARLVATTNPDVLEVADEVEVSPAALTAGVEALLAAADGGAKLDILARLAELLPTFVPFSDTGASLPRR